MVARFGWPRFVFVGRRHRSEATLSRSGRRHSVKFIGDEAEEMVARDLLRRDLVIWGRNVRLGALELDIVAIDGPVVVVVEVRARGRGAFQGPLESLSKTKRTRFLRAGERLWRRYFARDPRVERLRYDVAAVYREAEGLRIEYVRAAFFRSG